MSIEIDGNRAVGTGIALGAGVGATVGSIAGDGFAQAIASGVGTGIVLAALLALVAPAITRGPRPRLALVTLGGVLGVGVGGLVGVIGAWSVDAGLSSGLSVGGAAGAVLGVLVAGVLALSADGGPPGRANGSEPD